jgi:hypothetical protein
MRFVELKSEDQLDMQTLHRVRDRLVGQRTRLINQLRAIFLERGVVFPQGRKKLEIHLNMLLADTDIPLSTRTRQPRREAMRAETAEIVVEVAELRAKDQGEHPGRACAVAETLDAAPAGGIRVGRYVEVLAPRREDEARKVIGRGGGGHRQGRHHRPERRHRLETLAGGHDRDRYAGTEAEPNAIVEDVPASGGERQYTLCPLPPGSSQVRCRPVMRPSRSVTAAIMRSRSARARSLMEGGQGSHGLSEILVSQKLLAKT